MKASSGTHAKELDAVLYAEETALSKLGGRKNILMKNDTK